MLTRSSRVQARLYRIFILITFLMIISAQGLLAELEKDDPYRILVSPVEGRISLKSRPDTINLFIDTELPKGIVGEVYNTLFSAKNGVSPYQFSLVNGSLPLGLQFSGLAISGTPTTSGIYPITMEVVDSVGKVATKNYNLEIAGPLVIETDLPKGIVGEAYNTLFSAKNGVPPYQFSLVNGSLPPGLQFSGIAIFGTPTTPGIYPITMEVVDSVGKVATKNYNLEIAGPLVIETDLPKGTVGEAYNTLFSAKNGVPPYQFSLVNGSLPPGLQLSGLTLYGTPTTPGIYPITMKVVDSVGKIATKNYSLEILNGPLIFDPNNSYLSSALDIDGPASYNGCAYSQIIVYGGVAPYTYSIAAMDASITATINPVTGMIDYCLYAYMGDITIQVVDAAGTSIQKTFHVVISFPD